MSIHAPVVPVIAFEVLMDTPTDVATLLGELDIGNDKAVAELVVLLYSELRSLASRYLRQERTDATHRDRLSPRIVS